jgi:hypothetical protein
MSVTGINGITKSPGYIDEMTARGAYCARKRTIADRDAPGTQWTSVVLDEGVLPASKRAVDECSFTAPFDEFAQMLEVAKWMFKHQIGFTWPSRSRWIGAFLLCWV